MTFAAATIFALSSGRPPAAIAVVRISGPRAGDALTALIGRVPQPRKAMLARVREPQTGEAIDEALALWFPGPASETGEDMAELQLHGGRAIIAAVFDALSRVDGLRPAEAGEFTRRAFENGKLDLTRVEGLADLIGADTQAQRRQALRQLQGILGNKAEEWRGQIIGALAFVEAQIDFPDEGDVPQNLVVRARHVAREVFEDIEKTLNENPRSERLREGLVVAIAGPPNAGKSSLINVIARRDVAIVSPTPGTTRDIIEVHLDLGGYPVTLLDTAGIRDSGDPVEQEGVRRARARADAADLVLWVIDAAQASDLSSRREGDPAATTAWLIANKTDLLPRKIINDPDSGLLRIDFRVSALTGDGVPQLLNALGKFAENFFGATGSALITRQRQRACLAEVATILGRITQQPETYSPDHIEVLAEELRLAGRPLGRLTGRIDVEEILDVIFRDFCIGK